jgi:TetR/AcrR family transcriptional regulator, transcriptional repressor for nem operon
MPKCQSTRERIMDLAEHLIMIKGFNGFSYKDISTELNVKNAAIHYHFPFKKNLGVAVIRRAQARFRKWNEMIGNQNISAVDMLDSALEMFTKHLNEDDYVCLAGSLETDFNTFCQEMQNEIRIYALEIHKWMSNLLARGRQEGVFSFSDSPEDKAFFILSSVQGALQIARVCNKNLFQRVVHKIKTDLAV